MDLSDLVETPLDPKRKPYWEVLQEHQQALKDYPELAGTSVQEFARNMGPGYEAGAEGADNALRRGSGNIDIALHHFGGGAPGHQGPTLAGTLGGPQEGWDLPKLVGAKVRSGAEQVGAGPELAGKLEQVGAGFPRMAVDIGVGAALGGIPTIAGLSALSTYGETGKKLPAAVSGLSALLIPKAAEKVGGAFMRAAGAKTLAETSPDLLNKATRLLTPEAAETLGGKLDPTVVQKLAGVGGAQVGIFGVAEATETAQNLVGDGTTQEKIGRIAEQFSPSSLVATGFAQLPWTIHDLARTRPTDITARDRTVLNDVKIDFARRYTETAMSEQNRVPDPGEVTSVIKRVESGKTANDPDWDVSPQGQVLKSMGQIPIQIDLQRPVRTNTGDWPITDAIESVKATATSIATARPELGIEKFDEHRIASALRAVELGGASKLSREELSRQTAHRVIDTMTHDNEDLSQISPDYAELGRQELKDYTSDVKKNSKDIEVANKVMSDNQLYDPETAKRISLLSGNVTEQQAAGAAPRTDLFTTSGQPIEVQLPTGRRLMVRDNLLNQIVRDVNSGGRTIILTGDATAAARRAADDFAGRVDVNDPTSLGKFYNYVKKAVMREQTGFARVRGPEPQVRGKDGKVVKHPTEEAAVQRATELNADNTDETVRFETRKEPDGTFTVVRAEYIRQLSTSPTEAGQIEPSREMGEGGPRFEPSESMGVVEEEGIPKTTLDVFGEEVGAAERNVMLEQFHALNEQRDPAVREARKEAIVRNAIDFVKAMPDGKIRELMIKDTEGKNVPQLETFAKRKALFVKMMQFLRDGGDLSVEVTKTGKDRFRAKGKGNLEALNKYLGEHGYASVMSMQNSTMRGLNIFEQFHVLSKYLATEFINPNKVVDFTQRPRGDFAWMPAGAFPNEIEHKLLVSWPKAYPKGMKFTPSEHVAAPETVLRLQDRNGNERKFESKFPLADLFVKATKHQLTISAGELHDMFKRYAPNADPQLLDLLKSFVSHPFGSTIRVGFGIAKDGQTKGYYHFGDDLLTGTGILLSPFSETTSARHIRSVDRPEDVLPHLVHELAHAHTIFGYHNDPTIKAEVDQIWKQVSDYHKAQVGVGAQGKFTVDNMHSLSRPEEMLATIFHDPLLQEYLKTIPDTSPRGGRVGQFGSVFDRIMDVIRRVFAKIVGDDGANTMLQRVTDLTRRTVEAQESLRESLGLQHSGDIYSAKDWVTGKPLVGNLVMRPSAKPVPKGEEGKQVYPMDNPVVARAQLNEAQSRRQVAEESLAQLQASPTPWRPEEVQRLEAEVADAKVAEQTAQSLYDKLSSGGHTLPSRTYKDEHGIEKIERIVRPAVRTHDGKLFVGYIHADAVERAEEAGYNLALQPGFVTDRGNFYTEDQAGKEFGVTKSEDLEEMDLPELTPSEEKAKTSWTPGHMLESRIPKQPLLDSMKAASEYVTEDNMGQWFKPLSLHHFQRTFGPIFGDRLKLEQQGDQVGFRASPVAFTNVTETDLALAPKPAVKTWAVSAHEMMTKLFTRNGETPENAEVLAGYNMSMASLLRGTESAVWARVSGEKTTTTAEGSPAGFAWTGSKVAGLTASGANREMVSGTLRHEQTHLAGFTTNDINLTSDVRDAVNHVNDVFSKLNPDERDTLLDSLTHLTNQTRELSNRVGVYDIARTEPDEFAAEFMNHVGHGLGNVPNPSAYMRDIMRFVPDELSTLVIKNGLRRAQALEGLKQTVTEMSGQRGVSTNKMLKVVDDLANTFKSIGREALDIALDQADFYRMRNLYPDMYKQLVKSTQNVVSNVDRPGYLLQSREPELFRKAREAMGFPQDPRLPTKPSWWNRNVAQITQFADDHPVARPFVDMLFAARGLHNQRLVQLETAIAGAFTGGKLLDDQRTKHILKLATTQRLRDLLNKVALDVQVEGDKSFDSSLSKANGDIFQVPEVNIMTPEYMDAIYRKYGANDQERATLDTALQGMRNQIKLTSATMVDSHMKGLETVIAKAVARATNLLPEPAREVAKLISNSVKALDVGDHETALRAQNEFLSRVPDPVVAEKLFNLMNDGWQRVKGLERFLSVRMPYYMSERRPGDYGLWWRDKTDKIQSFYFKTGDERSAFVKRNEVDPIRQTNPGDTNYGVPDSVFQQLNDIQAKMTEKLTDLMGEKDAKEVAQVMDMATELRNAMSARDVTGIRAQRQLAKSRQYLDMFDTHLNYVNGVATAARNKQMRLEADLLLDTPEFKNQPVIKELLQQHLNNVIKPDTRLGQFVSMVNFVYFMGMNLSSMILEPFQQLSALAPALTRAGATVKDSYGHLAWANKAVIESKTNKGRYKDSELQSLMERARTENVVDQGIIAEMDHNTDMQLINRIRAVGGLSLFTPFEMFKNRVYQAANLTRRFYGTVPAYNSEAAFAASYKMLKGQGYTGEKLYTEISHLVRLTMLGGGKFNRPIGLFSWAPRSAAQAMWSLQSYSSSMMSLMGRMIKDSTFNPKGLTPAQTTQTRKAAVQMLGTQFVLAGALGMPFAQVGLLVLQKLFPDENIEAKVREFFGQFNGDDEALGGWMGNALTTGLPSAFSEAPDMGSRFALNSVLGVSPYSGISLDNVIGPTASVVKNVFKGIQAGVEGNPVKTVEDLMPRGILRIWKTLEEGNAFMSPATGNQLTGDLSPIERFGRIVGFTPARVARLQDAQRLAKASEAADTAAQRGFIDRTASLVIQGRDQEAHQAITQRSLESKGLHSPEEMTRSVARRVEQKTMPVDPRNFGSKQTVELNRSLKGILGEQTTGPSNTDRVLMQQQLAQRLGFYKAAPSARTLLHSSQLDRILEMYPHLTKPQAALLLNRATAGSPSVQELTTSGE